MIKNRTHLKSFPESNRMIWYQQISAVIGPDLPVNKEKCPPGCKPSPKKKNLQTPYKDV